MKPCSAVCTRSRLMLFSEYFGSRPKIIRRRDGDEVVAQTDIVKMASIQ